MYKGKANLRFKFICEHSFTTFIFIILLISIKIIYITTDKVGLWIMIFKCVNTFFGVRSIGLLQTEV